MAVLVTRKGSAAVPAPATDTLPAPMVDKLASALAIWAAVAFQFRSAVVWPPNVRLHTPPSGARRPIDCTSLTCPPEPGVSVVKITAPAAPHPSAPFVFVEKEDYTFSGAVIPRSAGEIELMLEPRDVAMSQPPLQTTQRLREEQLTLLKGLVEPIYPRLSEQDYFAADALERLALFDPDFVIAHLDELPSSASRASVLLALGEIDEAVEAAAAIKSPNNISRILRAAAGKVSDPSGKQELLAEALVHARSIEQPDMRVFALGAIAEQLYDLGGREAALTIIEEGSKLAEALGAEESNGYIRGNFAETLALFDVERALKLADLPDPRGRTQYWYCADIVEQGCGSVSNLAATLMNSPYWYFWWD